MVCVCACSEHALGSGLDCSFAGVVCVFKWLCVCVSLWWMTGGDFLQG